MTLILDLNPTIEQELSSTAARDGIEPTELAQRLLKSALKQRSAFEAMQAQVAADFAASNTGEVELDDYINEAVHRVREEMRSEYSAL